MLMMSVVVLALLTIGALFSAAETALTAASKPLIQQMAEDGNERAVTAIRLLDRRERLISTVLISNNLVNILASALTTQLMIESFGDEGVFYATAIITLLVVIYGEILPKTYALLHTTGVSLASAGPMSAMVRLFAPLNIVAEFFVNGALKIFGVSPDRGRSAQQILAELRGAIEFQMADHTVKEEIKHERAMLRSVLDLANVEVSKILIHRKKVVTIDADLPIAEIMEQVAASPYSRIPLWREQPDNIVGVLHAKNLLRAIESVGDRSDRVDVVALATTPWFIPDTTKLLDQMNAFRQRREHFAIVVDEYGALLGIVTLEDIIEEIVGDIRDEHDTPVAGIRPQADGSYLVDGGVTIRDINREFDWGLPDDTAATIAGLVLNEARTIPEPGQRFMFFGFRFDVIRRQRNQLTLVRVRPPSSLAAEAKKSVIPVH